MGFRIRKSVKSSAGGTLAEKHQRAYQARASGQGPAARAASKARSKSSGNTLKIVGLGLGGLVVLGFACAVFGTIFNALGFVGATPTIAAPLIIEITATFPPADTSTATSTATFTPQPSQTPLPLTATPTSLPTRVPTQVIPISPPPMNTLPPAPPPVTRNCDPSYPDVCIAPPPPDLNCKDVPYKNFRVLPPDSHHFDGDHDGIGCER